MHQGDTMGGGTNPEPGPEDRGRRRFLKYGVLFTLLGVGGAGAWLGTRGDESGDPQPTLTPSMDTPTRPTTPREDVPERVKRYAPDLYFDALEKWFPTDPRQYTVDTGDDVVVDGFKALEDYSAAARSGGLPSPTVFYNVVPATPDVDAIQYWMYSVFDQFTVNFHWHDWELLQVFVETDTDRVVLVSASAHSRAVPNNEFLNPSFAEGSRPGILVELGSHSSGSEVNGRSPSFERLPNGDWTSDITNDIVDISPGVSAPFAYGLPRGEGARLPFVMPELGGTRLDEYPGFTIDREDFIDERVTVGAWRGLPRPPDDIPLREDGLVLSYPDSPTVADAHYDLEPISRVRADVTDFIGPQLSFEFVIPGFIEDQFADHITSVGIPWEQERFHDPLADLTDRQHRRRLDGADPEELVNRVVGRVRELRAGSDGALAGIPETGRDAISAFVTVSLFGLPLEVTSLLASEHPVATVTRGGVFQYLHLSPGEHQLVINGPGYAPVAVRFTHDGGLVRVGAGGELTVVANEEAGWIRGAAAPSTGIARLSVIEDYAGVVFTGRPVENDRFAVAVNRKGRYTVEITDTTGQRGAFRVGPGSFGDDQSLVREGLRAGKRSLIVVLIELLEDGLAVTRRLTERDGATGTLLELLSSSIEHATAAASAVDQGDAQRANESLGRVVNLMAEGRELLATDGQDGFSDAAVAVLLPKIMEFQSRAETAIETDLAQ